MSSYFTYQNFCIYVLPYITLFLGWLWYRNQTKKNEITHFSINSYDVGKGLHDEFPEFQLNYEGKELQNEVHVLKGGFVNTGKDISGLEGDSALSITLPQHCSLKDIKVQKSNDKLKIEVIKNKNTPNIIEFGIMDKLMHDEGFKYTAIIESSEDIENLRNEIVLEKRIANTSLKKGYIGQNKRTKKLIFLGCFTLFTSLFGFVMTCLLLFHQPVRFEVREKGTNNVVRLYEDMNSQLYISDNKSIIPFLDRKSLEKDEFYKKYSISPILNDSNKYYSILIPLLLLLMGIIYGYFAYDYFSSYYKRKHAVSVLALNNDSI